MKSTKHDATTAKRVLTGMIVDPVVLGRVADRWGTEGLFDIRWANTVGGWAVDYYRRYRKAPTNDIESMFEAWAAKAGDSDEVALVDKFIDTVSEEYEELSEASNSEYTIDLAADYFNGVALSKLGDLLKGNVDRGDITAAMAAVAKWGKLEMGRGAGVDVLNDMEAVRQAFESKTDPLITYPGALGEFFGDQFGRDEFVAITGATGRGKTWWLLELAWTCIRARHKVAFFEVGDMTQDQIMRRIMCRNANHPLRPPKGQRGWPCTVKVPTVLEHDETELFAVATHEEMTYEAPLSWEKAWEACQKRMRRRKEPLLRLSCHPSNSISVDGITNVLEIWDRAGWTPDAVFIDYADTLKCPTGYTPGDREAINATWMKLRGLSQERHILVVTASQGDAGSYNAMTIRRDNFSDDRRKNDHVTAMLGLNQTEGEAVQGITRLNWTKRREEEYIESKCVHVAGSLNLGRPAMLSAW
jgi:hypothetical protein